MKIAKFSPIYGNNIGDIIISKCIEYLFIQKGHEVDSYDIIFRAPYSYVNRTAKDNFRIKLSSWMQRNSPYFFYNLKKISFLLKRQIKKLPRQDAYDLFLFGGGNILMNNLGSDYAYRVARFINVIDRKPAVIYAAGAGPFMFEKNRLIESICKNATYLSVRDKRSAAYFPPGTRINIDPAFMVSDIFPKKNMEKRFFGVNVISHFISEGQLADIANKVVGICRKYDLSVKLINTAYPDDVKMSDDLRNLIKENATNLEVLTVNLSADPEMISEAYSDLRFFLGARMHSIIFALAYEVPSLGLVWDGKVSSMFEEFFSSPPDRFVANEFKSLDYSIYDDLDLNKILKNTKSRIQKEVDGLIGAIR